jgi:excisionase family DNA binding protein
MASNATQPEELITKEQLAKRLNLTVAGVKNLIQRRAIPVLRLGHRTIRFRWSEVEVAIERYRQAEVS